MMKLIGVNLTAFVEIRSNRVLLHTISKRDKSAELPIDDERTMTWSFLFIPLIKLVGGTSRNQSSKLLLIEQETVCIKFEAVIVCWLFSLKNIFFKMNQIIQIHNEFIYRFYFSFKKDSFFRVKLTSCPLCTILNWMRNNFELIVE